MQNDFKNEFENLKNNLEILHILNVKNDAVGDKQIFNFIENAKQNIKESDFKGANTEKIATCQTINRCLKSMMLIVNEKISPDVKANDRDCINSNARVYHVKNIILNEKNPNTENKDFLANIIKSCEVLSHTIDLYQKQGWIAKEVAIDVLKIAGYKIANNFASIMKKDDGSKEFFNTYELRIDNILGCKEYSNVDNFLNRQQRNWEYCVKRSTNSDVSIFK